MVNTISVDELVKISVDELVKIYNAQASTVSGPTHSDFHDDQVLEGCDGWPDKHLDRHHDQTWYE